jgi:hypothetical protein
MEHVRWERRLQEVCQRLQPWVKEYEPGWFGLDGSAPVKLVNEYQSLMHEGYAQGWLP